MAQRITVVRFLTPGIMLLALLTGITVTAPAVCHALPRTRTITVQWFASPASVVDGYRVWTGGKNRQYFSMKQVGRSARSAALVTVADVETCYTVSAFNLVAGDGPWGAEVCVPPMVTP